MTKMYSYSLLCPPLFVIYHIYGLLPFSILVDSSHSLFQCWMDLAYRHSSLSETFVPYSSSKLGLINRPTVCHLPLLLFHQSTPSGLLSCNKGNNCLQAIWISETLKQGGFPQMAIQDTFRETILVSIHYIFPAGSREP